MAHRLYFQKDGDLNTTRRVCEDSLWLWIVRNYMTTFEFCMTDRKYAVATTDPVGIKGIGITSLTFDLYILIKLIKMDLHHEEESIEGPGWHPLLSDQLTPESLLDQLRVMMMEYAGTSSIPPWCSTLDLLRKAGENLQKNVRRPYGDHPMCQIAILGTCSLKVLKTQHDGPISTYEDCKDAVDALRDSMPKCVKGRLNDTGDLLESCQSDEERLIRKACFLAFIASSLLTKVKGCWPPKSTGTVPERLQNALSRLNCWNSEAQDIPPQVRAWRESLKLFKALGLENRYYGKGFVDLMKELGRFPLFQSILCTNRAVRNGIAAVSVEEKWKGITEHALSEIVLENGRALLTFCQ